MNELPTGTVTFLFTDIEGSTGLLQQVGGDAYAGLLEDHCAIIRSVVEEAGGREVDTEGDSFFVAFGDTVQAVTAVARIQRGLAAHRWPDGAVVRVRAGLHTGVARLGGDGYVGIDVHRAARIAAAGHGGQVLLSDATRALASRALPAGVTLRDLGPHRLKDLDDPEHLFQLVFDDLPSDFPPPRTLDARPNNLPAPLTSFVGRVAEIDAVAGFVRANRLVTLTGPGGTGKTRLALEVASAVLGDFDDGAFFTDLSPITDPALVAGTVARTLDVAEDPARSRLDTLCDHLADKDILLVLDNFERVTDAADVVSRLMECAPGLRVLVTSRIALDTYGEQEFPVLPLPLPDPARLPTDLEGMSQYDAVTLFIDRARSAKPDFAVTNDTAPAVAEITARLDGLPLAIELAASRVKLLTPQEILGRLEQRLPLLTSGARNLPDRQRTLRGAIEWSYDLLEAREQSLFARLAVFAGGCTLEGAEAVCNPAGELGMDTLEGLSSLIDRSLLRQVERGGQSRFVMLETIREYAGERLRKDFDAEETARRHLDYFVALAEEAEPHFTADEGIVWLDRFETEHDNLRSALRSAADRGEAEQGLRMAAAVWRFWQQRGHLREGRRWLAELLAVPGDATAPAVGTKAHLAAGSLDYWMGDYAAARPHYEQAVQGARQLGDKAVLCDALHNLAFMPMMEGDPAGAEPFLEEALALAREIGDRWLIGLNSATLGYVWFLQDRFEEAVPVYEAGIEAIREVGGFHQADWLTGLGNIYRVLGDHERAAPLLRESLELFAGAGNDTGIAMAMDVMAEVASAQGDHERAVRLAAATSMIKERVGGGAPPDLMRYGDPKAAALAALDETTVERIWAEGVALDHEAAVAWALE